MKTVVFYYNIFKNVIYSCNGKAVFSAAIAPVSVSHDPSETIIILRFATGETFLFIINAENSHAAQYLCEKHEPFFFFRTLMH